MPIVLNDPDVSPGDGWVWNAYLGRWRNVQNEVTEPELRNQAMLTAVANWIGRPLPHVGAWIRLMQVAMKLLPDEWIAATGTNGLHVVGPPPTGVPVVPGRSTPALRSLPGQVQDVADEVAAILAAVYEPANPVPFYSQAGAAANGLLWTHGPDPATGFTWTGGTGAASWSGVGVRGNAGFTTGFVVRVVGDGNAPGQLQILRYSGGSLTTPVSMNGAVGKGSRVSVELRGESLSVLVNGNHFVTYGMGGHSAENFNGRTYAQAGGTLADVVGQALSSGMVASAPAASYMLRELTNGLFDWPYTAGRWPNFRYLGEWKSVSDMRRPVVSAFGGASIQSIQGQALALRRVNVLAQYGAQVAPFCTVNTWTGTGVARERRALFETLLPFVGTVGERSLLTGQP